MGEPRTLRDLRIAIRDLEADLERIHMSPATVLSHTFGRGYLHRARTALRQAERHFAQSDPDPEPLKPLAPTLGKRRVDTRPRRKRYRCPVCFCEELIGPEALAEGGHYEAGRHHTGGAPCSGAFEPVARLPKGASRNG